jgi:hypothetical protein
MSLISVEIFDWRCVRIMTVCVTATISQYRHHKHSAVSRTPMWSLITKSTTETKSIEINLFKRELYFILLIL